MQAQKELDNVNGNTRAIRPAARVGSAENMQGIMDMDVSLPWYKRLLPKGKLHVMTQEAAKAQGVFVPNWWLSILLIPVLVGVLWFFKSLSDIQAQQKADAAVAVAQAQAFAAAMQAQATAMQGLKDTVEFRLNKAEVQGKLNDEHERLIENRLARIEGRKGIPTPE